MDKLDDFLKYSILFFYYKNLFSEKQKQYMELYLEEDYSFSEIAEKYDVSRQAVFDIIKKGTKQLEIYEEKLNIFSKEKILRKNLIELRDNFSKKKLDKIISDLDFDEVF